jgi:hypothetical protein
MRHAWLRRPLTRLSLTSPVLAFALVACFGGGLGGSGAPTGPVVASHTPKHVAPSQSGLLEVGPPGLTLQPGGTAQLFVHAY